MILDLQVALTIRLEIVNVLHYFVFLVIIIITFTVVVILFILIIVIVVNIENYLSIITPLY